MDAATRPLARRTAVKPPRTDSPGPPPLQVSRSPLGSETPRSRPACPHAGCRRHPQTTCRITTGGSTDMDTTVGAEIDIARGTGSPRMAQGAGCGDVQGEPGHHPHPPRVDPRHRPARSGQRQGGGANTRVRLITRVGCGYHSAEAVAADALHDPPSRSLRVHITITCAHLGPEGRVPAAVDNG